MKYYRLVEERDEIQVPACLFRHCKDKEKFPDEYESVAFVTDVIKEELLSRMNKALFPDKEDSLDKESLMYNMIYVKTLKELISLLP